MMRKRARSSPARSPREKRKRGRLGSVQREHVRLREVVGDVMCLYSPTSITKREYRAVIEVSSTNYALQSEEEQDAIIEGYPSFIKALTFPLQILIRSQQLDLSAYLQQLTGIIEDETCEATWRELAAAHRSFVEALSQRRSRSVRRF